MSTREEIDSLTKAVQEHTDTTQKFLDQVSSRVMEKEKEVDQFIAGARNEFPMPHNLVANPYMDEVENDVPVGYSAVGLTLSAVHPYTKAFEGVYAKTQPDNATTDVSLASQSTPFFFGEYKKGPRFPVWGGGLADGWYALGQGNILKIQSDAGEIGDSRSLFLPAERRVYANEYSFRIWVHIAKGSVLSIGAHAGYGSGNPGGGLKITKEQCDSSPQGWFLLEGKVNANAMMGTFGHGFTIGFASTEAIEAYIAMPYIWVPLHPHTSGMSMGE